MCWRGFRTVGVLACARCAFGVFFATGQGDTMARLTNAKRIIICACGTSFHSGLVGEYLLESLARIPVEVGGRGWAGSAWAQRAVRGGRTALQGRVLRGGGCPCERVVARTRDGSARPMAVGPKGGRLFSVAVAVWGGGGAVVHTGAGLDRACIAT